MNTPKLPRLSGWTPLRYALMHWRSPFAQLAYKHRVQWLERLQNAYMRRLVRRGIYDGEIDDDGKVIPRHQEVAIPPSLLAFRRRNRPDVSPDGNSDTR